MLDIRTSETKKGISVYVLRQYKHIDTKTKRAKYTFKKVGTFTLAEGCPSQLIELLQPEEILQLQNWLADVTFAQQFKAPPDELIKDALYLPPPLIEVCNRLYIEAKRTDVDFIPHHVMLEALLFKAKLTQQKIDKINGFNSGLLESIGIDSTQIMDKAAKAKRVDEESRKLFRALLEINQSIGKTCSELEAAAKHYEKERRITPMQLKDWAENPNPHKIIKKWCYAIAIDVLHLHGINPINLIPAKKVAEYWALQQHKNYSLIDAQKTFAKQFAIPKNKQNAVAAAIAHIYHQGNMPR